MFSKNVTVNGTLNSNNHDTNIESLAMLLLTPISGLTVVLLLLTFCLLLLPFWESVIVPCFVVRYFMSILVLQPS